MSIAGIGVDVVDLARFERAVARTPALRIRLFAESERDLPLRSLAGRFAAKEALIKALGDSSGVQWHDMTIVNNELGNPSFVLSGGTAEIVARRGITEIHVSMSHDAGIAIAYVIAESDRSESARPATDGSTTATPVEMPKSADA
jgi:holo-[acyl-carrier protein] synthase